MQTLIPIPKAREGVSFFLSIQFCRIPRRTCCKRRPVGPALRPYTLNLTQTRQQFLQLLSMFPRNCGHRPSTRSHRNTA